MENWNEIKTLDDIDQLLKAYGGFHDSCLVEIDFSTGSYVDEKKYMCFGTEKQKELHMVFHSQWAEKPLELWFTGVRRFAITGWQDLYGSEILDCHLAVHTDLVDGKQVPLIVWADDEYFEPKHYKEESLIEEPSVSYVIASGLKWRFMSL